MADSFRALPAGQFELDFGAADGILSLGELFVGQIGKLAGTGQGFTRFGGVEIARGCSLFGQNGHSIINDLGEAAVNVQTLRLTGGFDADQTDPQTAYQRRAIDQHAHLTVMRRKGHKGGVAFENLSLGRNHAAMECIGSSHQ